MTDKKQILDNLMEHGKTTGKLTTKEITDALEKLDYDVEQMDSFYDSCAANNIEIIDDIITDDSLDTIWIRTALIFPFQLTGSLSTTRSRSTLRK